MSSNTRLRRYEHICLHLSVIMSVVVLVSNLSSVNSSTTTTIIATTTSPQETQTTKNVHVSSTQSSTEATSPSGNDTTAATTTLQSGSTEETSTAQPQSTTNITTTTTTTTTNNLNATQSPEMTTDNMSTQSSADTMTPETTSISVTTQTTTTVNTTAEPDTTTTPDTITTETLHHTTDSTSEGVESTTSTEATDPVTVTTTTTLDSNDTTSSVSDTTTTTSTESTSQTTTQGSSNTTSSALNTTTATTSVESTVTPNTNSTEATTQTTTIQEPNNTNSMSNTTTEAPSTHSTESTIQTTTSTNVDNTTVTQPSTAAITTTQPTTTTTTATTTTTKSYQITPVYPDTENAVLEFTFELRFTDCTFNETTKIEKKLSEVSNNVIGCKFIRVKSIKSCSGGRRKRSASTPRVTVDTVFGVDAQRAASSGSNVSNDLYINLSGVDNIDVDYLNETRDNFTGALMSKQICDSDVCTSALVGRPGFVCVAETSENNTQRCAIMYYCDHHPIDCGKHGHCYVATEIQSQRASYSSKCRCAEEEFFRYEGTRCTERVMTWELAVIICASASGALILLLLFIIIVMCCRNASNSADVFEDSELMYTPSGIASANGKNGRDASKGVENQGYMEVRDTSESWKPEASANTYAHIESKLRENNYDMQIKRPQVTQFRKSDEITEF